LYRIKIEFNNFFDKKRIYVIYFNKTIYFILFLDDLILV
jgi:hypothetical protein